MKIFTMVLATAACVLLTKGVYSQQANGDASYDWNTQLNGGSNTTIPCGATFTIKDNDGSNDVAKTVTFSLPQGSTGTITVTLTSSNLKTEGNGNKKKYDKLIAGDKTWQNGSTSGTATSSTGSITVQFVDNASSQNSTFTITVHAECDDPSQINWNNSQSSYAVPCGDTYTITKSSSNNDVEKTVTFSNASASTITVSLTGANNGLGRYSDSYRDKLIISDGISTEEWVKTNSDKTFTSHTGTVSIQFENGTSSKKSSYTISVVATCNSSEINWNSSESSYNIDCGSSKAIFKSSVNNDAEKTVTFSNASASTITVTLANASGLKKSGNKKDKLSISDGNGSEDWENGTGSRTYVSHSGSVSIQFINDFTGNNSTSSYTITVTATCNSSEINWNTSESSYNINCGDTKTIFKSSVNNDESKTVTFTQSNASIMAVTLVHNGLKSDKFNNNFDQLVISDGTDDIATWNDVTTNLTVAESTTGIVKVKFLNNYSDMNSSYMLTVSTNCTSHTLTYDLNCDGQHESGITPGSGILVNVTDQEPSNCNGQIFDGWNTAADGSGTTYVAGDRIRLDADMTLYAQYHTYYTVSYNTTENRHCEGARPIRENFNPVSVISGGSVTISDIPPAYCDDSKTFDHWNTAADDSGTPYDSREVITNITSDITLYAIYKNCYTLTYNTTANCSTQGVSISSQTKVTTTQVSEVILPDCGEDPFTRWNTAQDGSGTAYNPGQSITLTSNTTLYAQYALSECSQFLSGKSIEGGAEIDNDTIYYNACKGVPVKIGASIDGEDSDNWDWNWYVNAHDANPQRMDGDSIQITPSDAVGYDINITAINKNNGCKLGAKARMRVSPGLTPTTASYTIPNGVCVNEERTVRVGNNVDDYDIAVPSQVVHVSALKGQSEETFIPDGPNCTERCYESTVTFTEFDDNARISTSSDIEYIRINMEHSFIGDVQISLVCPTGKTAIILQDWQTQNALDTYTYDYPYSGSRTYGNQSYSHLPVSFGIPSRTDGGSGKYCDSRYNPAGTGWDYCWSTMQTIDGQSVTYGGGHSYVYETANHEDAAPTVTYRVVKESNVENLTQFYKPYQDFYTKLQGCPLNGTWKVKVCDSWKVDNGYVFEWDLKLSDRYYPDPWQYSVEIESLRLENAPDFVEVSTENPTNLTVQPTAANGGHSYEPILYVIDNLGCESQTPVDLNIEVKKPFVPTISGTDKICFGSTASLSASHNIEEPAETPTYEWADALDETDVISSNAALTTEQLMEGHTYIVTVTYRTCTATMSKEVEVSVPDPEDTGIGNNDFVWAGINDGNEENWNVSGNWIIYNATTEKYSLASGTTLPTSSNNAFVVSFGTNCVSKDPTLSAESYTKNLVIGEGHTVTVSDKKLNIAGDLINDGTLSAASGTIEFNGNNDQKIKNSQTFKNIKFNQQTVNKITSLDENDPVTLTIKGGATFTKGIVDADVIFSQGNDAKVANASSLTYSSFVNKSVTKEEKFDGFVFPTGNDNVLGTVTATVPGTAAGCAKVTVSYHHNDGENADGSHGFTTNDMPRWWNKADMCATNEANFDHVSNYEFWNVNTTKELTGVTLKVSSANAADHYTTEDYTAGYVFGTMYSNSCWMQNSASNASSSDGKTIVLENVTIPAVSSRAASPSFMTFASINPGSVLPIELVDFTAKCESYGALLEWATASERDNDYFIIEHSSDAMNFSEIARIAGAGNSINTLNYSYVDYNMFGGDNYYRLIQVDYDGTRSASEIIALNCGDNENEPAVEAYPNPFNSELEVSLKNFNNMPAKIELFDMLGKLVYFEEVESTLNQYDTTLQLGHLAQATYTMRVCTGDKVMVKQIVKR